MTRVGFYVIQQAGEARRLQVAARLADKAFQRGQDQAQALDTLLWGFRPSSFLPHGLAGDPGSDLVAIGWGEEPARHDDLLINLQLQVPAFFARFHRVAEVVTQDDASLAALRESWRFYKARGYQLEKHDLSGV